MKYSWIFLRLNHLFICFGNKNIQIQSCNIDDWVNKGVDNLPIMPLLVTHLIKYVNE